MDRALNELLFHTAFACMACDGDIAPEEVQLIKNLANKDKLFGNIDIYQELDSLCQEVNVKGKIFLKEYFSLLASFQLEEVDELKILQVAALTIHADNRIEYSEIRFFKIIRSYLKVDDQTILNVVKNIDSTYLAQDIKMDYLQLYNEYFDAIEISNLSLD